MNATDWSGGTIVPFAGTGKPGYGGDGGPAGRAELNGPAGLSVDAHGNLYIAEIGNNTIRKVDGDTGLISTIAGNGRRGFSGDGGPALKAELCVHGLRSGPGGTLYFVDFHHHVVRKIVF